VPGFPRVQLLFSISSAASLRDDSLAFAGQIAFSIIEEAKMSRLDSKCSVIEDNQVKDY
jgi:hypothetical protein